MGVGAGIFGVSVVPIALGFGVGGVVACSVAAGIQAGIGNVAAGSIFALCQSAAATGLLTAGTCIGIGTVGAGVLAKSKTSSKIHKNY